jgi:hypothetical protein
MVPVCMQSGNATDLLRVACIMCRWPFAAQVGTSGTFHHVYLIVDMDVLTRPDVNGVVEGSVETAMKMLKGVHLFTRAPIPKSAMPVVVRTWRPRAGRLSIVGVQKKCNRSDCTGWSCSN